MMIKFRKTTYWFLILGGISMGFSLLTRYFFAGPEWLRDFLIGFGVAMIFGALLDEFRRGKAEKKVQQH